MTEHECIKNYDLHKAYLEPSDNGKIRLILEDIYYDSQHGEYGKIEDIKFCPWCGSKLLTEHSSVGDR